MGPEPRKARLTRAVRAAQKRMKSFFQKVNFVSFFALRRRAAALFGPRLNDGHATEYDAFEGGSADRHGRGDVKQRLQRSPEHQGLEAMQRGAGGWVEFFPVKTLVTQPTSSMATAGGAMSRPNAR